jgi:hypothetical protein
MRPVSKLIALVLLLVSAACVPVPNAGEIEDVDMPFHDEAFLAPGEGVVVLGGSDDAIGKDNFAACLREELQTGDPPVRLIPASDFQDTLFPWFELDTRPSSDKEFVSLFRRPEVQFRIKTLSLRHILLVTSSTSEGETAGVEAVVAGVHGSKQRSRLTAKVIDLKNASVLGDASVEAAAAGGLAHFMIYGIILVPTPGSTACEGLSRQLGAVFAGKELPPLGSGPALNKTRSGMQNRSDGQ